MGAMFTVVLVDRWGHAMCRDGSLFRDVGDGERPFEAVFSDIDSARRFCEGIVQEMPHVECDVLDQSKQVVLQHRDEARLGRENERMRGLFAQQRRRDRIVLGMGVGALVTIIAGLFLWLR